MDRQTFQQAMAYLAAAYETEITRERAAVYWDQLGGLRGDVFMTAVKAHVGHGRRFPRVAELRESYQDALRRRAQVVVPKLSRGGTTDREKVRSILDRLRRQMVGRTPRG